ncbi:hypothetical protein EMPS_01024 [Entomortierella parvispora]|uniref:Arm-like repeat domain-containing protein n=1 Tax=Entomortierella parvispora TaxID=205924 RepID=A0A9P3LS68_9FUNG|nr:hypothetical protein EMPS_01024 [Entomortierella parvispora]
MVWYKWSLPAQDALKRAKKDLEKARNAQDKRKALRFCDDAKEALGRINISANINDLSQIVSAYREHGRVLETLGHDAKARVSYGKADELSTGLDATASLLTAPSTPQPSTVLRPQQSVAPSEVEILARSFSSSTIAGRDKETVFATVFAKDCPPSTAPCELPRADEDLKSTQQLANCLGLIQASPLPTDILDSLVPSARNWLEITKNDIDEQERLSTLATDLVRALARDELKDQKVIAEILCLAPAMKRRDFQAVLKLFVNEIKDSALLDVPALDGLAQLIQSASPGYIDANDLVQILTLLNIRLQSTFQKSSHHVYQLTLTVSRVLDAMVDSEIEGLDRVNLHEPLLAYFEDLKKAEDPYLVFQAVYTYQALLSVPDDEEIWRAALRRTGAVIKGVSGLASAIKGLDITAFIDGLQSIQGGLRGANQFFGIVMDAYTGVMDLKEGGQGFLESLKSGLSFKQKRAWYPVLRAADVLVRNGELVKFKALVWEAPCRLDQAFQWGLCQRLRYLAVAPYLDVDSQKDAVAFLGEIYCNELAWGQEPLIKQCILDIVLQLASLPDRTVSGSVSFAAATLLQELKNDGDRSKQALYEASVKVGPGSHLWSISQPLPDSSTVLLDRVQNRASFARELRLYKRRRQEEAKRHAIYISPQAKASRKSPDTELFELADKVNEFLKGERKAFLIIGDSGAGKSTFNLELELQLWKDYESDKEWVPLFVSLPEIHEPEHDLIPKQLHRFGFKDDQIQELKAQKKFILICDGYDECQRRTNLYSSNRMNDPNEWIVKMIISCRSEFLEPDYQLYFQPGDRNDRTGAVYLQEAVIVPFSSSKVQDYIQRYVDKYGSSNDPTWSIDEYWRTIQSIPNLLELVTNPFLLSLALDVLPSLVNLQGPIPTKIARVTLYDEFLKHWIERGQKRLIGRKLSPEDERAFRMLSRDNFSQRAIALVKELAVAMYCHQEGRPVVEFSHSKDQRNWKAEFFSDDYRTNLLRETAPIVCNGNQHRFIHKSVLEYGLARAVFEPWKEASDEQSFVDQWNGNKGSEQDNPTAVASIPVLFRKSFVQQPSIIGFLVDRVLQSKDFENQLHDIIHLSKTDRGVSKAAANAITILVRAGIRFHGVDLRGIRVPGADLSYGQFDSAQLQGADMSNTLLSNIWLREANLSHAQMQGADFGEWPFLATGGYVSCCAYSPAVKEAPITRFAVGLADGTLTVYDALTWDTVFSVTESLASFNGVAYSPCGERIASFSRGSKGTPIRLWDAQSGSPIPIPIVYDGLVSSIAFSPDGQWIVTASDDMTIRLWNARTGSPGLVFRGHSDIVSCVAFSLDGKQIVSCSHDKTVRLWDIWTREAVSVFSGHDSKVSSVAYSPIGNQIASGDSQGTIRLWDIQSGETRHVLKGHNGPISCLAYSLGGHQVISGSLDWTVRLWGSETGAVGPVLSGHKGPIACVASSPDGRQIASGSGDTKVRLWDAHTGVAISRGHTNTVWEVARSPNGCQIASGGEDNSVRLWDAQAGVPGPVLIGHTNQVRQVMYAPSGKQIASGSWDATVRLWDAGTGAPGPILSGHKDMIMSLAYSPCGQWIAAGSTDGAVRIWDTQTGKERYVLTGHRSLVTTLFFSRSGQQIASGSRDRTVRLWDVQTGKPGPIYKGHTAMIKSIAFSQDDQQIASGSEDSTVQVWDTHTGKAKFSLEGQDGAALVVVYSPNGLHIAAGSWNRTIRLWDAQTGEPGLVLAGHSELIWAVEFTPDSQRIASFSPDKTLRIWDVTTGQCLLVMDDFHDSVRSFVWDIAQDGICFVTGNGDFSVQKWRLIVESETKHRVQLVWSSSQDKLVLSGTSFQDVQSLSKANIQLIEQRGALNTPVAL